MGIKASEIINQRTDAEILNFALAVVGPCEHCRHEHLVALAASSLSVDMLSASLGEPVDPRLVYSAAIEVLEKERAKEMEEGVQQAQHESREAAAKGSLQ